MYGWRHSIKIKLIQYCEKFSKILNIIQEIQINNISQMDKIILQK